MALNWVRDLALARGAVTTRGYMPEMWLMAYHMLRCAGYKWIWECDGHRGILNATVANHVPDGNMEDAGTADWVAGGGTPPTVSKNTSTYYSGSQSLEIAGQLGGEVVNTAITSTPQSQSTTGGFTALGGGLMRFDKGISNDHDFTEKDVGRSITFTGSDNPVNDGTFTISAVITSEIVEYTNGSGVTDGANAGLSWWIDTPIHIAIWVNNTGSQTWNVDVDRGDGSPTTIGSFSGTVGWEIKHFDFYMQGNGNIRIYLRPQGTLDTIYIDSVLLFRSFFEFTNDYEDYASGDTGAYVAQTASDEFESTNYTFVAGDVGKLLMLFDQSGNHPKNTGCYTITGINAGRAVLDLRSPTASLASQNGSVDALSWRMVDVYKWAATVGNYTTPNDRVECYNGFGLESPHSSKWRFVCRGLWIDGDANNTNGCLQWSAPEDSPLDVDTGNFFIAGGPSIQGFGTGRNKTIQDMNFTGGADIYADGGADENMNWMRGRPGSYDYTARTFMLFDDGGAWFFVYAYPTDVNAQTAGLFGIVGQDAYHPGIEAHCHMTSRDDNMSGGTVRDFTTFASGSAAWWYHGKGIMKNGQPTRLGAGQFGYWNAHDYVWEQSNAQANPFSGDEWIQPLFLIRGGSQAGGWSEREAEGIYQGRDNMNDLTTFGNEPGVGDSFAFASPTVTLTDGAGAFTPDMDGKEITIQGATSPANDGTFVLTYISPTQVSWTNASGVAEAFTGTWSVNMAKYLHLRHGLCIDWMEERIS